MIFDRKWSMSGSGLLFEAGFFFKKGNFTRIFCFLEAVFGVIPHIGEKKLDISTLVKYNLLIHYKFVTKYKIL
jgi:hypothetical protein